MSNNTMDQELEAIQPEHHLSINQVLAHVNFIKEVMGKIMIPNQHFGIIPGCKKPSLLKAGAEVLFKAFQLRAEYEEHIIEMGNQHREYQFHCRIYSIGSGRLLGEGMGSACTLENKWRYKGGVKEFLGKEVPKEYWNYKSSDPGKAKEAIGGEGFGVGKNPETGKWEICVFGEKMENDNPADLYNTVRKMGKKRCMVDGAITVTGCSDIFTQDIEEEVDKEMKDVTPQKTAPAPSSGPKEKAPEPEPIKSNHPDPKSESAKEKVNYKEKCEEYLFQLCGENDQLAIQLISECTSFNDKKTGEMIAGKSSLQEVSEKALPIVCAKLRRKVEALGT